jgi:SOS-response transcriptional repressor LexA
VPAPDIAAPVAQEWIPLVADVAAGEPMIAPRNEAEDWYSFKAKWVRAISRRRGTPLERFFAVKVARGSRGESMLPTIRPGASLVIDPGAERTGLTTIDSGAIYVCRPGDGDGWTVKRAWLTERARYLVLKGDNPDQGAIVEDMKGRELRSVIVGKVVYIGQEEE